MFSSFFAEDLYIEQSFRYTPQEQPHMPLYYQIYRTCRLAIACVPPIITYPLPKPIHHRIVKNFFSNNGYVIMKIGQWLATRTDLLPVDLCQVLSQLHNKAPIHSFADTIRILKNDMYDTSLFMFDSQEPIGSGSIAQVYKFSINKESSKKALFLRVYSNIRNKILSQKVELPETMLRHNSILKNTSHTKLAVKVVHPGMYSNAYFDCKIMLYLSKFLTLFPRLYCLNIPAQIEQFKNDILKQIDLRKEECNMRVMRHLTKYDKYITVAEPILATKNVLVMEYIDSNSLLPNRNLRKKQYKSSNNDNFTEKHDNIACMLSNYFVKSLFYDRFIHIDLHPGNLAITRSNKLVVYDLGLTKLLSQEEYNNFIELFYSLFIERDGVASGNLLVERLSCNKNVEKRSFANELGNLVNKYFATLNKKNISKTTNYMYTTTKEYAIKAINVFNKYGVKLDYKYNHIFLTGFCLDGILRQLQPNNSFYRKLDGLLWRYGPISYILKRMLITKTNLLVKNLTHKN